MEKKVLVVDDDENIRKLCRDVLEKEDFEIDEASNGRQAIFKIERQKYDLVLLDLQMPDIGGFEVIRKIREFNEIVPVIIITGHATIENAVNAIKMGANDFIVKPFDIYQFLQSVKKNLEMGSLTKEVLRLRMLETLFELNKNIISLTDLNHLLDKICQLLERVFSPLKISIYLLDENQEYYLLRKHQYRENYAEKVKISYSKDEIEELFGIRNSKSEEKIDSLVLYNKIKGREKEIGLIEIELCKEKRIRENDTRFLELFSTLVGIAIENSFLLENIKSSYLNAIRSLIYSLEAKDRYTKGHSEQVAYYSVLLGKKLGLSEEEIEILKISSYLHDLGKLGVKDDILLKKGPLSEEEREIIKKHPIITVDILRPLNLKKENIEACLYHHERVDGTGYPKGLSGKKIPFYAKILAIADAYSAMISERPYRKAMDKESAIKELMKNAGSQFDRELVKVFISILNEMEVNGERN